jgi:hypothetical protein
LPDLARRWLAWSPKSLLAKLALRSGAISIVISEKDVKSGQTLNMGGEADNPIY